MAGQERAKHLKKGRKIETFSVIYNLIEVAVSLTAGFIASSSALIGWGLDSSIEAMSAGTLLWRLHGEEKGISEEKVKKRKRIAMYVIAFSFFAISAFITYDATSRLITHSMPSWSTAGMIILVVSLIVNPFLGWAKLSTGKDLKSAELKADAVDTFICLYQTVVVLGGLLLVRDLNLWWADPVAALLIVPYALYEGREIYKKGKAMKDQNS